jgi:hypothetical protein
VRNPSAPAKIPLNITCADLSRIEFGLFIGATTPKAGSGVGRLMEIEAECSNPLPVSVPLFAVA